MSMQVMVTGIEGGLMVGVEYPKRGEHGKAGFATATLGISDRVLRAVGPQVAAETLTRKFKAAGFSGPDICADITSALRLRLHVIRQPSPFDLTQRVS